MPDVPGCPRDLVIREIREAAIELCEFSCIWRVEMITLGILAGIPVYDVEAPRNSKIVKVMSVRIDGRNITPKTVDWLDQMDSATWRETTGTAKYYVMDTPETILLNRKPKDSISGGLNATLCLKPSRSADTIPEYLFEDWINIIAMGAKEKLMLVANKAWSNPTLAIELGRRFSAGKSRAKIEAIKGHSTVGLKVKPRRIVSRR